MPLPKKVFIREVGPREGLQTMSVVVPTAQKIELIRLLSETGVKEIELTAMVRADRVPQMADAEALITEFVPTPGVRYTALYLNRRGFERATALGRLDLQGWIYSATSDTFLQKNSNTSRSQIIAELDPWLELFASKGTALHGIMFSTAFGCAYEGKAAAQQLVPTIEALLKACNARGVAPTEISLADTVGLGTPEQIRSSLREVRACAPGIRLSLHLHDTRGTGIANAYAGLCEGIDCFDASVGGVGGCPFTPGAAGNIATEDLVYLCHELGVETGISLDQYVAAARFLETIVGQPLPGKYYRVGQAK